MRGGVATAETSQSLEAVQGYLDALYNGDADLFAKVMHREVRLYDPTPAHVRFAGRPRAAVLHRRPDFHS